MGRTFNVYQGESEDVIDRFDETFGEIGTWSRSAAIKEQLELAIAVEEALESVDAADIEGRERRAAVRQALLDYFGE
jgi:hypothetical protein